MALKGLKDIPSGGSQLVLGFYVGNHRQEGERALHAKRELDACGNDCLLRPGEQDTEVLRCLPGLHSGFWPLLI